MTSVIVRVFVDSVGDYPATTRSEPQPAMRVPDLPVQRAPVIKLLLAREHAVHDTCEIARRAVDAHLHSSDGTRGRRLEAAPSEEAHDTDTRGWTQTAPHMPQHMHVCRGPTRHRMRRRIICTFAFRMDRGRARANARVTLTYTGTSIAKTEIHAYIQPTSLQKYI